MYVLTIKMALHNCAHISACGLAK